MRTVLKGHRRKVEPQLRLKHAPVVGWGENRYRPCLVQGHTDLEVQRSAWLSQASEDGS